MTAGLDPFWISLWNSSAFFFDTLQFYILLVQPWFISKIDVSSSDETVPTIATLAYIYRVVLVPHKYKF